MLTRVLNRLRVPQVAESVGKKVFGNTAGFSENVTGVVSMTKAKVMSGNLFNRAKNPYAIEMLDKGYSTPPSLYDKDTMDKITSKYKQLIEDDAHSVSRKNIDAVSYTRSINSAHKNLPELASLLNEQVIQIIEDYYQSHFQVLYLICWRNYYVPQEVLATNRVYAERWHCDARNTDVAKLFVNISDVTDLDGPFHIQSKARTRELSNMAEGGNFDTLSQDVLEDPKHVVKAIGPIGTAMVCNTELCIHRAGVPAPDHQRDIVQFQFVPSTEPLRSDWLNHVQTKESEKRRNTAVHGGM